MSLKIAAIAIVLALALSISHWAAWKAGRTGIYKHVAGLVGVTENINRRVGDYVLTSKRIHYAPIPMLVTEQGICINCHEGRV